MDGDIFTHLCWLFVGVQNSCDSWLPFCFVCFLKYLSNVNELYYCCFFIFICYYCQWSWPSSSKFCPWKLYEDREIRLRTGSILSNEIFNCPQKGKWGTRSNVMFQDIRKSGLLRFDENLFTEFTKLWPRLRDYQQKGISKWPWGSSPRVLKPPISWAISQEFNMEFLCMVCLCLCPHQPIQLGPGA